MYAQYSPLRIFSYFLKAKNLKTWKNLHGSSHFAYILLLFCFIISNFFLYFWHKINKKILLTHYVNITKDIINVSYDIFFLDFNKFFLFLLSQLLILFLGVFFLFIKSSNVNELQKEINSKIRKKKIDNNDDDIFF